MKKTLLVTKNASLSLLSKLHPDAEVIGLDEGIFVAKSLNIRLAMAISSFNSVDLNDLLSFIPKDKIMKYEDVGDGKSIDKIIKFLISRGSEEIVILDKFNDKLEKFRLILSLLKEYKGKVSFQDDDNQINYYQEGVHIINKQEYNYFSVIGFPEANISIEHVSKPIKNVKISFFDITPLDFNILERVAVLKVNKGGVLLSLATEKDEGNNF